MTVRNFDRSDWLNFIGLILGIAAAVYFYLGYAVNATVFTNLYYYFATAVSK